MKKIRVVKEKDKERIKDLKEQLARALADYDNLRKRVEREKETIESLIKIKFIAKLLPVLDMLEAGQKSAKDSGIAIITKEFKDLLEDEGVKEIDAKPGDKFDEELHEVVEVIKLGKRRVDEIAEVTLTGWRLANGLVIRPAKVKVARK